MTTAWKLLDRFPAAAGRLRALLSTPTRRRLAHGAFWGILAGVAARALAVVVSFLIARILGREQFGEYGVVSSTAALIGSIAGLGVGLTATKYIAEFREKNPDRAGRIIGLSTLITCFSGAIWGLAFVVLAPWLAAETLAAPHLTGLLRLSALSVALAVINGAQISALAGFEAFRASALVSVISGCLQAPMMLIGCWLAGLPGLVLAFTASMALACAMNRVVLVRQMRRFGIRVKWRESVWEWPILVRFSLPAFLSGMLVMPVLWACTAMLANQPNGYYELGAFNAANQWYVAIQFLPSLIATAVLPVLSERHAAGDIAATMKVMKGMVAVTAAIVVPTVLVLCLLSKPIMAGYGASFVEDRWVLVIAVVTSGLVALMTPVGQVIVASERMWIGVVMNMGWATLFLVLTAAMVDRGAEGLAWSRLLAYIAHGIWTLAFVLYLRRSRVKTADVVPAVTTPLAPGLPLRGTEL
ncbi:MAG TPA: oligosaccharide flippase family protein [Tepidisphaeraceae bacterium]|nr:oligosaccharide flippase family protein [Tepidisphaeraceae bacterium]